MPRPRPTPPQKQPRKDISKVVLDGEEDTTVDAPRAPAPPTTPFDDDPEETSVNERPLMQDDDADDDSTDLSLPR
jgi:hypothetical protein